MSDQAVGKFDAAIRQAVVEAIKAIGVGNFKRCSFFLSNEQQPSVAKKAA